MLRLLSLLLTYRYWSGQELADRLGVTARTLRRDIERLRDLGYPVHATRGVTGGYRLDAGGHLPPLLFDDDEAVALAVGLRTSAGGMVTGIEESSVRALAKLEQVLPSRLRRRVNALKSFTVPLTYAPAGTVDPETLTLLAGACRDNERLRFVYRSRDGAEGKRHVEPFRLVSAGRRWYLVAYDLERDDWRTFRLDRLTKSFATGARFVPRELPGGDAAEFVRAAINPPRFDAVITTHAPAKTMKKWLRDDGTVEPIDARSCRVRFSADSVEWSAVWIGMWGVDFEVHEPPELVDQVQQLHERFGRATAEYTGRGDPARTMELVWNPPDGIDEIVNAAIAIADENGLPALTLRRVADRLGVDYAVVQAAVRGKAELLDVVVDQVQSEAVTVHPPSATWRDGLEAVARTNYALVQAHPWLLQLVMTHPPLGPSVLAKWESELMAVDGQGLTDVEMDAALTLVIGHAQASARAAADFADTAQRTGATDAEWWSTMEPLLSNVFDSGRFPISARVGEAAAEVYAGASDPKYAFEFGLQRILDGVAALIASRGTL